MAGGEIVNGPVNIRLVGVREYGEGQPVSLVADKDNPRLCIVAVNEGGHNSTSVDLLDLIQWVHANRPELLTPQPLAGPQPGDIVRAVTNPRTGEVEFDRMG
jgi:hypothetical protein